MLIPLYDRIVVKRAPAAEKVGTIIIPGSAQEFPNRGEVLAVGPGKITISGEKVVPQVKVGDSVLFTKHAGMEIDFDGEKVVMMTEEEVLAIISPYSH